VDAVTCSHNGFRIRGGEDNRTICFDCNEVIDVECAEVRAAVEAGGFCTITRTVAAPGVLRWDAPQEPYSQRDADAAMKHALQRPRYRPPLYPASFVFAWSRRWKAHWLSQALGYPSKEPPIR
jgi:hypothetical protein